MLAVPLFAAAAKNGAAERKAPQWADLTAEQQRILAPLAAEWDSIENSRRNKWIAIAKRYPKMTPQGQERLQSRMKQWASMTPEQRADVRERYRKLKELPPEKREEIRRKWREYNQLTEEEKLRLRQAHPGRPGRPPSQAIDD